MAGLCGRRSPGCAGLWPVGTSFGLSFLLLLFCFVHFRSSPALPLTSPMGDPVLSSSVQGGRAWVQLCSARLLHPLVLVTPHFLLDRGSRRHVFLDFQGAWSTVVASFYAELHWF